MVSIGVLLTLAVFNVAAGFEYPPLFVNAAALLALIVVAWRELRQQRQPGPSG